MGPRMPVKLDSNVVSHRPGIKGKTYEECKGSLKVAQAINTARRKRGIGRRARRSPGWFYAIKFCRWAEIDRF